MSAPVNEVFSLLQTDDFLDLIRALGEDRPPWILNLNVYTSIEDIDRSDEIFQQLVNAFVSNTSVAGLRLEADETTMLVPFLENLVPLLTPLQHIELALDCNSCAPIARVIPVIFRPQPDSAQRITRLYLMRVVFDCDFLGWVGLQNSDTLEVVKVDGCSFDVTNSMDFMDCFKNTKKHDAVGLTIASSDFEGLSSLQVAKDIFRLQARICRVSKHRRQ
jgi:hypothetical protein